MRRAVFAAVGLALMVLAARARGAGTLEDLKKQLDLSPVVRPVLRVVTGGTGRLPPLLTNVLRTETGNERWDNCPVRRALVGESAKPAAARSGRGASASGDECTVCNLAAAAVRGSGAAPSGTTCTDGRCPLPSSSASPASFTDAGWDWAGAPEDALSPHEQARAERLRERQERTLERRERAELRRRRGRKYGPEN